MKTISKILTIAFLSLLINSCDKDRVTASHEITTRAYAFSGYSGLDISDNFTVHITFSETTEKVEIEANDNLHGYIRVDQRGDKLTIKLEGVREIKGSETLNVFITTRHILDFRVNGNSKVVLENPLISPTVKIDLAGSSWFSGTVASDRLAVVSTGNCMIHLSGDTGILDARLTGNCELSDYALSVQDLKLDLSGNSNAYLSVSHSIDITAKGNSMLFYKGDARIIHQDLSSASRIIKN